MSSTVIIGAGPAGLTAAYEAAKRGRKTEVFEQDNIVGGLSRTLSFKGYRFDLGGHRFFTKSSLVRRIWNEILEDDLLERERCSRIYYNNKFFSYPLRPLEALVNLGPVEASRIALSFLAARIWPDPVERTFEQWISNRFGHRLFEIFFKTYTEKVWGMACSEISADWAAQRIKNLDLLRAVKVAVFGQTVDHGLVTTLIDRFQYPRFGPGMMWEVCSDRLEGLGSAVHLNRGVQKLVHSGGRVERLEVSTGGDETRSVAVDQVISTMPLGELIRCLEPSPPERVLAMADRLRYRDFLTVGLIVSRPDVFPDNWIYVHSPDVRVGRVQNFKNWSPEMVPDASMTSLGLEYFVNRGDELWSASDRELVDLGTRELAHLGLISPEEVEDGVVFRVPKAYPIYDSAYRYSVAALRRYLAGFDNLQTIGRNGMHRYNNQDHSMLAGVLAARNLGGETHDVWRINVEQEYLEEDRVETLEDRKIPETPQGAGVQDLLKTAFALYDPVALGGAFGSAAGVGLFLITAVLFFQDLEMRQPMLSLLGNYLMGYELSWVGALLGLLEAVLGGFGLGFVMAVLINALVRRHANSLVRRLALAKLSDPLTVSE
jgi:protoporphyrinogen oxidase